MRSSKWLPWLCLLALPGWAQPVFDEARAHQLMQLPLKSLTREYPNKPEHVMNGPTDLLTPSQLHPAFYGSYDWHSSVHGHWMLVRLLKRFPNIQGAGQARALLERHLSPQNIALECAYFQAPNRQSFERPYGWAWLLKLAQELRQWDDPQARRWADHLQPLADLIVARYLSYFPKQNYPIRSGVHSDTAFGLTFAWDYGDPQLRQLVRERALTYYADDRQAPVQWEPGGDCFLSPSLCEADLMRRVLSAEEFAQWFDRFWPDVDLQPALVSDRSDPKLVHLDGLNLSRAWALQGVADSLPAGHPQQAKFRAAAERHGEAGVAQVLSGDYAGEHWLASFAIYWLSASNRLENPRD
jgi:hypothetical protein